MDKEITIRCESIRIDKDQYRSLKVTLEDLNIGEFFNAKEVVDYCSKNYVPEDIFTDEQLQEWHSKYLNPSGAAPQVFIREQVAKAYADGAIASQKRSAGEDFQTEQEYMDINYPNK